MNEKKKDKAIEQDENLPGYPEHDPAEDIYNQEEKLPLEEEQNDDLSQGLDVPGSELDDENELIGEEDEENNYYSLGGDNHEDLEEN